MWKRSNKYNAQKVKIDGITLDSKAEARHYNNLKLLESLREITDLKIHPRYPIVINEQKICTVVLDFEFFDTQDKRTHYIDVKGMYLSESKLRHKLLHAVHNIKVEIWK